MNYYERVQQAIDFVESNIQSEVSLEEIASKAYMSLAGFYRMFFTFTGFTVKEYIRRRRINEAAKLLCNSQRNILDIAMDFNYESQEAFTRSFKQVVGVPPGAFRKRGCKFVFERMNILDRFLDMEDWKLAEQYPDIRIHKELKPIKVAYYRHISKTPENDAGKVLMEWVNRVGLGKEDSRTRIFGFNNPNPPQGYIPGETEYGYELWATIPDDFEVCDENVKSKVFEGGAYAVTSISGVSGIVEAWEKLSKWLCHTNFMLGSHQWLEEHIYTDKNNFTIDLYIPIARWIKLYMRAA